MPRTLYELTLDGERDDIAPSAEDAMELAIWIVDDQRSGEMEWRPKDGAWRPWDSAAADCPSSEDIIRAWGEFRETYDTGEVVVVRRVK